VRCSRRRSAEEKSLELAGCYVVTSDVNQQTMSAQQVHDGYLSLQKLERDFCTIKTGLLEVRPIFLRDEARTRGHVLCCMLALKLSRELQRRLQARFGTTDNDLLAITLPDALAALSSLCLLQYRIDENTTVIKLPQPTANQKQILDALGVSLPPM
jgi:transposase